MDSLIFHNECPVQVELLEESNLDGLRRTELPQAKGGPKSNDLLDTGSGYHGSKGVAPGADCARRPDPALEGLSGRARQNKAGGLVMTGTTHEQVRYSTWFFEIGFGIGSGKVWTRKLVQTLSETYLGCPEIGFS